MWACCCCCCELSNCLLWVVRSVFDMVFLFLVPFRHIFLPGCSENLIERSLKCLIESSKAISTPSTLNRKYQIVLKSCCTDFLSDADCFAEHWALACCHERTEQGHNQSDSPMQSPLNLRTPLTHNANSSARMCKWTKILAIRVRSTRVIKMTHADWMNAFDEGGGGLWRWGWIFRDCMKSKFKIHEWVVPGASCHVLFHDDIPFIPKIPAGAIETLIFTTKITYMPHFNLTETTELRICTTKAPSNIRTILKWNYTLLISALGNTCV